LESNPVQFPFKGRVSSPCKSSNMYVHKPVLLREILEYLECADAGVYVDGTIGEGGHTEQILERSSPTGRVIGIDLDEQILQKAHQRLERFGSRVQLVRDNFKNIKEILKKLGLSQIDGFLADLGISSYHLNDVMDSKPSLAENQEPARTAVSSGGGGRGFSFQIDAPLDMRLDQRNPLTAAEIVNQSAEGKLATIIWEYGEERWSRRIARAICTYREKNLISTTGQLAEIVRSSIPAKFRFRRPASGTGKIDPATRTFQALRIAVNQELVGLDEAIRDAVDFLKPGARICIISFHSLEDRIVKRCFRSLSRAQDAFFPGYGLSPEDEVDMAGESQGQGRVKNPGHSSNESPSISADAMPDTEALSSGHGDRFHICSRSLAMLKVLTPKPIMATQEEVEANVRARSAKLRVAVKCR
jgi:16S rRNA (cytosine1402-N4)-methyltransferase